MFLKKELRSAYLTYLTRGSMTIQAFLKNDSFQSRVYFDFDKKLKYVELKKEIYPVRGLEYKGAGIRCYGSFAGMIMRFFQLATKVNVDGKVFCLNNKSLCQFAIRKLAVQQILKDFHEADKIAKFKEVALRIHDSYLRFSGTHYPNGQLKEVLNVMKETVRANPINDTDGLEELYLTLLEVAENSLSMKVNEVAETSISTKVDEVEIEEKAEIAENAVVTADAEPAIIES